jgi:hypothetical protein
MANNDALATGSVVLTANADPLTRKLNEVDAKMRAWAKRGSGGGGGDSGDGVFGRMAKAATPTLGKITAGATAAAGAFFGVHEAIEGINDIAKQGKIASAMGMSPEQFTGIAGIAKSVGEDTREFIESLVTLGKMADEVAQGKGEVAPDFFKKLNLDAKEFAKLRPDEMFFKFFDSIKSVQDPLQRTRMLMVAFGEDGGKYLLPLLSKSPEQLRAMAAGFQISSAKMQDATFASERLLESQNKFRRLWQDIIIAAAPVFEFLASEISTTIDSFRRLETSAAQPLEKTILMVAKLSDTFKGMSGSMMQLQGLMLKNFDKILVMWSLIKGAQMGGAAGAAAGGLAATALLAKLKSDGVTDGLKSAGAMMGEIGERMLGEAGKSLPRAEEFIKKLRERREGGQAAASGKGWLDSVFQMKPAAPAITPKVKFAEAILAGSKEAYSLELRNRFGNDFKGGKEDEAKKTNKNLEKANRHAVDNKKILKSIDDSLKDVGVV